MDDKKDLKNKEDTEIPTIVDYINRYYDVLVKRMPLYNIAEVFKREGFKK